MRDFDQILTDIIHVIPKDDELAALSEDQKASLTSATNCLANAIYLTTAKGRALREEIAQRRANQHKVLMAR